MYNKMLLLHLTILMVEVIAIWIQTKIETIYKILFEEIIAAACENTNKSKERRKKEISAHADGGPRSWVCAR